MEFLSYTIAVLTILYLIYNKIINKNKKQETTNITYADTTNIDWTTHSKPNFDFSNIQSKWIDY